MLKNLARKYSNKGFVGPKYHGLTGKLRFIFQNFISHRENIYYFDRRFQKEPFPNNDTKLTIRLIFSYTDSLPFIAEFERAYYEGFTRNWRKCFACGEELVLAFYEEKPVAFCWIQVGTSSGGNYCLPYFEGDYRSFRAGVLPDKRGRNFQAMMNHAVVVYLIQERSAHRIYSEVYVDNIPSCKAYEKIGFRIAGVIRVWSLFSSSQPYIQWVRFFPSRSHLVKTTTIDPTE